ncbi:PQQ-binding-like beta-propeller repeat protein [Saccharibacillus sp. CPCC 101409]|uniref:outer membrane protein assembly factor BamB family protein n=1 Tax=Saccharibacillus sp. CPCC 101409 TaxID=3058041 RepID=UPI002671091B|nr:PQQ-binding-like beta-propeller repeat protein [Saccharibacillus sp. CPCC 101409]MDO3410232.1 PQQ-binding-like beta-propeller repeat protein [Saccharibacillus sp. CPCC 101409]
MKSTEKWGALVLSAAVLLSTPPAYGHAQAAPSALPQPSWTSSSLYDAKSASVHDVHAVSAAGLVYAHTVQSIKKTSSKTSYDWYQETITAFDANSGARKWTHTFHDKAGPYTVSSSILYTGEGSVYFVGSFSDKTQKIYALGADGKLNWTRPLSFGSDVYLLGDESLLIASPSAPDKRGAVKTSMVRCDASGKTLAQRTVQGSVLTADGSRIVVDTGGKVKIGGVWDRSPSPSIAVCAPDLNTLYTYRFPSSVNLLGDGGGSPILVLGDGSVIFRGSVAGTVNRLFAFEPKGRLLWARTIPADSVIASFGSGYVTYSGRQLSSFSLDRQLAQRTLDDQPGQIVLLERSGDGLLQVDMNDTLYILDPDNLNVRQAVSNRPLRSEYAFAYDGGVLYAADAGALVKYTLQADARDN